MDLKWNKQDVCNVVCADFNLRVFTSKSGERCRNYNSLYMCLPPFKGQKVMGQTNNHKSNFHFLILGCKSFAVNYSQKSGMHRHHQMLGFIPGDALPHCSTATVFSSCLFLGHFPFSFVFSKWDACSIGFRSGDWLGQCITFHFFALKNSLVAFAVCFGSLSICICPSCEVPSNEFWSIWLNMSR